MLHFGKLPLRFELHQFRIPLILTPVHWTRVLLALNKPSHHFFCQLPSVWRNISNVTNQEGRLALSLLPEVVRPQLEMAKPLRGVLWKLAHLAMGVRGQGSCLRRNCGLLVARVYRNSRRSVFSLLIFILGTSARWGWRRGASGCWGRCRVRYSSLNI